MWFNRQNGFISFRLAMRLFVLALVLAALAGAYVYWRDLRAAEAPRAASFTAFRGPMEITVLEGGSVEARDSLEIKSEVQGSTKILSLVEEGYQITPEDVENKKVLVELDSKELVDKQISQELEYQSSLAALTEALEQYEIQINQNESDITAAELAVDFARMDLEKYLGQSLAMQILKEQGLDNPDGERPDTGGGAAIDFSQYAHPDKLGDGEARQKLRQLEDEFALSAEEVSLAETKFDGAKRLFDREFVTKTQLDTDQMAFNRKQIARQSAETSRDLFIKYEFPKMARKLFSDYEESLRALERVEKLAHSKMAQAEAKKISAEARHTLQTRKREEIAQQIACCTIVAPRPGLVVYGTGEQGYRSETIEEGASVRERQVILTVPDMSVMAVRVQVHESFVKKVRAGQQARVRIDAYPNELLTGKVYRIAVLPDSQNRWLNPDLKVYSTTIHVDGQYDWLKPGMSAEAEIIVEVIPDAVQVPVNAVHMAGEKPVCYVAGVFTTEARPVTTGEFNISFIQILEGVSPGESVLLTPPELPEKGDGKSDAEQQNVPETESAEQPAAAPETPEPSGTDSKEGKPRREKRQR